VGQQSSARNGLLFPGTTSECPDEPETEIVLNRFAGSVPVLQLAPGTVSAGDAKEMGPTTPVDCRSALT